MIYCPDCNHRYPISKSKRVQICPNCDSLQKTGLSLKDIASRKAKAAMDRSRLKSLAKQVEKPKAYYKIPFRSVKGAKQDREVTATKRKLKAEALDGGHVCCEGCGKHFDVLDCSHKIPLSQNSELASDAGNIRLLCRGCHEAWEGNRSVAELIALKCFTPDMRHLFDNDKSRFYNILDRLLRAYNEMPTPKLEMALGKVEKFETETQQ